MRENCATDMASSNNGARCGMDLALSLWAREAAEDEIHAYALFAHGREGVIKAAVQP
jgi:hypothetical protein